MTGAPKVQAMKVIATLESTRREVYTGAIGIASPIAGLDMSVVIRTFETAGDAIWIGVGGAIVADSDPELELAEALTKAAGPVAAIGGRLAQAGVPPATPRPRLPPRCAAPRTAARSRARRVRDGARRARGAGRTRAASGAAGRVARELYGAALPPRTAAGARAAAGQARARRAMRILADATAG